jgi:hypothetical protein
MNNTTQQPAKVNYPKLLIGVHNDEKIYLSPPSWDCGWYWGFGYLGNKNCHSHVDGLKKEGNTNLFDAFKNHFGKSLVVRDSALWTLCELFETFYTLKEAAEVLGRGGSHMSSNPCKDVIINVDEVTRINTVVLPAIFASIYELLERSQNNPQTDKQLLKEILKGDTNKVVDFMLEYKITTDDLKNIEGVTSHDFDIIHSAYWKRHHAAKKQVTA